MPENCIVTPTSFERRFLRDASIVQVVWGMACWVASRSAAINAGSDAS
jgi:hypothetical protein